MTRTAGITGLLTVSEQNISRSPNSASASSQAQVQGHLRQLPAHTISPSGPKINHNSSIHKQQEHMLIQAKLSPPANTEGRLE